MGPWPGIEVGVIGGVFRCCGPLVRGEVSRLLPRYSTPCGRIVGTSHCDLGLNNGHVQPVVVVRFYHLFNNG